MSKRKKKKKKEIEEISQSKKEKRSGVIIVLYTTLRPNQLRNHVHTSSIIFLYSIKAVNPLVFSLIDLSKRSIRIKQHSFYVFKTIDCCIVEVLSRRRTNMRRQYNILSVK